MPKKSAEKTVDKAGRPGQSAGGKTTRSATRSGAAGVRGKTSSPARLARSKRIVTVYFLREADLRLVKAAAKRKGVPYTVFIREAALDRAI